MHYIVSDENNQVPERLYALYLFTYSVRSPRTPIARQNPTPSGLEFLTFEAELAIYRVSERRKCHLELKTTKFVYV